MNEQIADFEQLLIDTKRPGIDKLIEFLRKSDFYTAPASTRYHSCHEGGLLEHSMLVYQCLMQKLSVPAFGYANAFKGIDKASIAIISLLHDVCKTYTYVMEMKNKKVYSENGTREDSNGRYDWVSVPGYTIDDRHPYGHGEKSVMIIEQYIKLSPAERYAIRFHMGFTEPKEIWNTLSAAIMKYPIILATHEADLEATYLLEKGEE